MRVLIALVLALSACANPLADDPVNTPAPTAATVGASTSTTRGAPTTNAPTPTNVPTTSVGVPDDGQEGALVQFEANWLCDAQRHVYNSPSEVDEALETSLSASAFSRSEYDAFKAMSGTDEAVRKEILALFVEVCS